MVEIISASRGGLFAPGVHHRVIVILFRTVVAGKLNDGKLAVDVPLGEGHQAVAVGVVLVVVVVIVYQKTA